MATTIAIASPTWLTSSLANACGVRPWVSVGCGISNGKRLVGPAVQVVVGVDRDQALDLEGSRDVDVDDPGVGVRAAHERCSQRVLTEVVQVATTTGEQPRVLDPRHPLPEQLLGHGAAAFLISAARRTAATMFW